MTAYSSLLPRVCVFILYPACVCSTTPEKWDAVSRRLQEVDRRMMQSIGLMMVDEIHLLNEVPRGATLEGLMSRCLMRQEEAQAAYDNPMHRPPIATLRIIGLSATAPNANDLASWLDARVRAPQSVTPASSPIVCKVL